MDDLEFLNEVFARYRAAAERLRKASDALWGFSLADGRVELERLFREEAEATGAYNAWFEAHQLVANRCVDRANRKESDE